MSFVNQSPLQKPQAATWSDYLLRTLYAQFQGKPVITALISTVIAPQVQALWDATLQLFTITAIDDGVDPASTVDHQLDVIGKIVNELRSTQAINNALYRLRLKARIAANKSEATVEDIYAVFGALWSGVWSGRITKFPIQTLLLEVLSPVIDVPIPQDANTLAIVWGFLLDSVDATARVRLDWQPDVDAELFSFAGGSGTGKGFDDGTGTVGGKLRGSMETTT